MPKTLEEMVMPGDLKEAVMLHRCHQECFDRGNYAAWKGDIDGVLRWQREMERCTRDLNALYKTKRDDDRIKAIEQHKIEIKLEVHLHVRTNQRFRARRRSNQKRYIDVGGGKNRL